MIRIYPLILLSWFLVACGDPIGTECQLTSGALGFGFDDHCRTKCLQLQNVVCPDETEVRKAICAGAENCGPGTCGSGEVCYSFEDPIKKYSYCIPADFCGNQLTDAKIDAWESASLQRPETVRAEFKERMEKRSRNPEPTAAVPVSAPAFQPAASSSGVPAIPNAPTASVLIESWGFDMALVMCISDGVINIGADCADHLPAGMEIEHGGWRIRSTGPKTLPCAAMRPVPGVGGESIMSAGGTDKRWHWVPTRPAEFIPTQLQPLDASLLTVIRTVIPSESHDTRIELAATADFDGNGADERVLRVFTPTPDPDKPDRTTFWLVDKKSVR